MPDRVRPDRDLPEITWSGKGRALIPEEDSGYRWAGPDEASPAAARVVIDQVVSGPMTVTAATEPTTAATAADPSATAAADTDTAADTPEDTPETVSEAPAATTENLAILGESGRVLTALTTDPDLAETYLGKVRLCYIDPPFNTGGTFGHYDDDLPPSMWLSMMLSRLELIHTLLSDDGTIWVHLDDSENHRMRMLLDEVFGPEHFVADIAANLNPAGRRLGSGVAKSHDRILVYAKDRPRLDWGTTEGVDLRDFPLRDTDGTPYRLLPLRNFNRKFTPKVIPTLAYPLYGDPDTGTVSIEPGENLVEVMPVFGDLSAAVWRWGRVKAAAQSGDLTCRRVKGRLGDRVDIFQKDYCPPTRTRALTDIWLSGSIGSSVGARNEITSLIPEVAPFDTPKPERLLARIIGIATDPGDVVLDVFGGSGTTAAVAHKLGRRWVTCELSEYTFSTFLVPRLTKVITGTDPGGITSTPGSRAFTRPEEAPEKVTPTEAAEALRILGRAAKAAGVSGDPAVKALRRTLATRPGAETVAWHGGGSFRTAHLGDDPGDDLGGDLGEQG